MSLEKFLQFLFAHNATIIEMLLGLTLLVVLFLSIRMFLTAKEPSASSAGSLDLGNLETTLKQILEKAGQVPAASAGASEDTQKLVAEIANLKHELQLKQKTIEDQSSATATASAPAASGMSADEKAKLEAQLNELQAKLSEYEIISEDIADLSFYKEQNAKLQKDIEALKAGAGGMAAPAAAPIPAATPPVVGTAAEESGEPEIVGKSRAQEVPQEATPEAIPAAAEASSTPAAPAPAENLVDDDLMAEFAAAVEKQKAPAEPAAETPAELGEMNMDKMLAEAAEIKTDVPEVDPEKALGTTLDENKLLQEAAALEGVTSEDKRLMGEFENFVKKNEN